MKIALLGDTHFGARGDSQAFHKYFFKFYDEVFFPYLKEHNISEVIQLGDLMDRRKFVNYVTLHDMREKFISKFKDDLNLTVIIGNHDIYYRHTNRVCSLNELFGNLKDDYNINIILDNTTLEFGGINVDLIPWITKENHDDTMQFVKDSNSPVCLGHFEISGFSMYKGFVSEGGLSVKTFDKYEHVFSGHFHTKSSNGNIMYLGTPYEIIWSDYNDPRGFHIFDTETGDVEFILNPNVMHHKIMYDDTIEDFSIHDVDKYNGSVVKLVIVEKSNVAMYENFIDKLENEKLINLSILDMSLAYGEDDLGEVETQDTLTVLYTSVDALESTDSFDKARMKKIIKRIYDISLEQAHEL